MTAESRALTSVIMVTYNTGPVLYEAIASVLAQNAPIELILVNNGNPEDDVKKLAAEAQDNSRFKFITGQGNVGFSKGCNNGAKVATGEYLLFLNPDSSLLPDAISKLKYEAASLRRPFMLGARVLDKEGKDQRGSRRAILTPVTALIEALHLHYLFPLARLNYHEAPMPYTTAAIPAISGSFMFIPREDFWGIGGFDEGYFLHVEDLDLCLRFRRQGGEIYIVPRVVVTHIGATSKATKAFIERHKAAGFRRYFHKNFSYEYPSVLLVILDMAGWIRAELKIWLGVARHFLKGE